MTRTLALWLALALAASGAHAAPRPIATPAGRSITQDDEPLEPEEYRQGLEQLRSYLQKHDEDSLFVGRFIDDLEEHFQGERRLPVTHGTFSTFLKYEAAWARKTRDAKNPKVSRQELAHEQQRAEDLRLAFNRDAMGFSPRFYTAFRAAVQDVRSTRGKRGEAYSGSSEVFFGNQINDVYTKIDAADEALDRRNAALARRLASAALAQSPRNADALVMRAGAAYAMNDMAAAAKDARAAMQLDPGNQQARAIMDLSGNGPTAGAAALANAAATGGDLGAAANGAPAAGSGATAAAGAPSAVSLVPAASLSPARAAVGRLVMPLSAPPSATPALGVRLSSDLTARAARGVGLDPQASIQQLDRAIALDPRNVDALDWRGYAADKQGDYRDALAAADRALEIDPRDARALYNRAYALAGEGDKAGALDALRQAAGIDPAYQPALQNALQLAQNGDMTLLFRESSGAGFRTPSEPGLFQQLLNLPPTRLLAGIGALLVLLAASQLAWDRRVP